MNERQTQRCHSKPAHLGGGNAMPTLPGLPSTWTSYLHAVLQGTSLSLCLALSCPSFFFFF